MTPYLSEALRRLRFSSAVVVLLFAAIPAAQEGQPHSATPPSIVKEVKATYTPAARAARIEGRVVVQAIVAADGTVSDVKVIRSLDTKFGLDVQALNATKQWIFKPGTRDGKPVAVTVAIEQSFFLNSTK
jgi:TonB family protein